MQEARIVLYINLRNVHHSNEPDSRWSIDTQEIRRYSLCLAPLLHLLRGPHSIYRLYKRLKSTTKGYREGMKERSCGMKRSIFNLCVQGWRFKTSTGSVPKSTFSGCFVHMDSVSITSHQYRTRCYSPSLFARRTGHCQRRHETLGLESGIT